MPWRILCGTLVALALPAPATAAAAEPGLQVPDRAPSGVVRLEKENGDWRGTATYVVRNASDRGGTLAITYQPAEGRDRVPVPGRANGIVSLVDPKTGKTLDRAPRAAPQSLVWIGVRIELPGDRKPRHADGTLIVGLRDRDSHAVGRDILLPVRTVEAAPRRWDRWIALATAIVAAIAAGLSAESVRQARKARLEAELPKLAPQPVETEAGELEIRVHNEGGGLGRATYLVLEQDGTGRREHFAVGDGSVPPGATVEVPTGWRADPPPVGIVYCFDASGNCRLWDLDGKSMRVEAKKPRDLKHDEVFDQYLAKRGNG